MLRWAILGTGFISNTVVEAIAQSPDSEVVIVAGRDAGRTEAFRAAHTIGAATNQFQEAISHPDVDAVYIGTPNHQHHQLVAQAAAAGKAVLSEKSLTTTMQDANDLVASVRDRVFFVEGLMYLAHPLYLRVIEILTDGRLGTLKSVTGRYSANIADVVNPLGRGTIYNLGCYPASLLHLVVQTMCADNSFEARTLSGVGNLTADNTIGDAALMVQFANGVLATLHATDDYGMSHDFAIAGTNGVLRFDTNPWLPAAGSNILTWTRYGEDPEQIEVLDENDAFYHQIRLVERGFAAGSTEASRPSPRLSDSLEIMSLLTDWEAACLNI